MGFGRIGQATAERVLAFGSDVLVRRRDGGGVPGTWPEGRVRACADLDEPIFSPPKVVLTPHMAAGTQTTQLIKARAVFANIARVWAGDPIEDQVL